MITIHPQIDTEAREASPGSNYANLVKMGVRGAGSSAHRYVFIKFAAPWSHNSTITTAMLRLTLAAAWSGTNDLTIKRVTEKWGESTLKYNNMPTVNTPNVTDTITGGAAGDVWEVDITDILQAAADGSPYYGIRIGLTQDQARLFYSGESNFPPELDLDWSDAPDPPDRLSPDSGLAVDGEFISVAWRFQDHVGTSKAGKTQAYSQVQLVDDPTGWDAATGFPSPDYDTGQVANVEDSYDLDDGSFTGLVADTTYFWTVSVWDDTGFQSEFSQPGEFVRTELGTLTIDSPGATVPETTPPIAWTLTDATQVRYRVILYEVLDTGKKDELWRVADTATDNTVTPPNKLIKTGHDYRVTVEVWDDVDRWNDEHLTETMDFTYVRDGSPDPVTDLAVELNGIEPSVTLTWERAVQPDYWGLRLDDEEVEDRLVAEDYLVSGTTYSYTYWGATPREAHTYEIEAIVLDSGVYKHSSGNPDVDATTTPIGIWLVDQDDNKAVMIAGVDPADLTIGETGTTYDLVGARAPVRITDIVRGYEGTVSGLILSQTERADMLTLKGRRKTLQLILGDLSIPIVLEEVHLSPTPTAGDAEFAVSFTFFQVDAPWPTRT